MMRLLLFQLSLCSLPNLSYPLVTRKREFLPASHSSSDTPQCSSPALVVFRRCSSSFLSAPRSVSNDAASLTEMTFHSKDSVDCLTDRSHVPKSIDMDTIESERLNTASSISLLPRHIAFICDGNSRWAEQKYLVRSLGHAAGAQRVRNMITALMQWNSASVTTNSRTHGTKGKQVEYCTFFAFSTENWSRPASEVADLFQLIERMAVQYRQQEDVRNGRIQIKVLGNLDDDRIPESVRRELRQLETDGHTANPTKKDHPTILTVCLAVNYGGRTDILLAAKKLALSMATGELALERIGDESEISSRLSTANFPDPDLIIRTGGEQRLSNFLLWNAAYAELYFSDILWPDFDKAALKEALIWFEKQKRRFGGRE